MARVGLADKSDAYPDKLSGGQQQRIALARALVYRPSVLLMDEPLGALDRKLRDQMKFEIKAIQQRLGVTVVYVTHDQVEAMTLADKIVVLEGGIVQQIGAPMELYKKPANKFVAGFIGSPKMNFLEVEVVNVNGGLTERQWEEAVAQNAWVKTTRHRIAAPGAHIVRLWMIDPGLMFQRIHLVRPGTKLGYLGPTESPRR